MATTRIIPGLYQVAHRGVNVFFFDGGPDGVVLIDAGYATSAPKVLKAIASFGFEAADVRHILVTHLHADHTGGLAELKAATGARVYMHQSDAVMLEMGRGMRRLTRVPGLVNALLHRVITGAVPSEVEAVQVDQYLNDGEVLPIAGGIDVIHTPGHTEGHVVFRSRMYNALFLGDAAANLLGLREMFVNEQRRQSQWSLKKLAGYRFNTACFGHGSPILAGGGGLFHAKWGDARKRR